MLRNPGAIDLEWVPSENGAVPAGAIEGGFYDLSIPTYITRTKHGGMHIPGKLIAASKGAYFPVSGKEIYIPQYDVLCVTSIKSTSASAETEGR